MTNEYPRPLLMIDIVMLTLSPRGLQVALLRRSKPDEPHYGEFTLPGGFVHVDKDRTAEDTAIRVLESKLKLKPAYLEQLGTYTGATRDSRGWSATIAYIGLLPYEQVEEQLDVQWEVVDDVLSNGLPFDHADILKDAVSRIRSKTTYSSLPVHLMPPMFTMSELRKAYEQILRIKLEPRSFSRRIEDMNILLEQGVHNVGAFRPATLYRAKSHVELAQLQPSIGFSVK